MSHHGAFDPAVLAGLDRTQVKSDYDTLIGAGVPAGGGYGATSRSDRTRWAAARSVTPRAAS
ncbi:hypothetical protein [Fodinicola feengrottensis]|uniref:hypothetical protein n=1 Tax=Fodinicola feengrottensis TaxID=435914 RepID=UPI0013D1727A|nr:hypothetical protein [Fodinicola feengrottensis]